MLLLCVMEKIYGDTKQPSKILHLYALKEFWKRTTVLEELRTSLHSQDNNNELVLPFLQLYFFFRQKLVNDNLFFAAGVIILE